MIETGEATMTLQEKDTKYLIHPVTALRDHEVNGPFVITSAKGSLLYDADGRPYVDSLSGLWNCCLGHGRADMIQAIREQMERVAFVTTFYGLASDTIITWAEKTVQHLPGNLTRVFPNVTGSEANDTAFKFTRMYFGLRGQPNKLKIISQSRGYHGVASGVLGATAITEFWRRFGPLPPHHLHIPSAHCYRCPYGRTYPDCEILCATVLEQIILAEDPGSVAAFIAEPIIGGGGVVIPPMEYLRRVREICTKHEVLYIDDEIITGFGRTGKWFAIEHYGVEPDILTMGKGMTAGYLPMFATAIKPEMYRVLADSGEVLWHGFTHTGQPAMASAALKVMEIFESERLVERVAELGTVFAKHVESLMEYPWVGNVRSLGLLAGIEFVADRNTKSGLDPDKKFAPQFVAALRKNGIVGRVSMGDTLVLAPPFVITEDELDQMFRGIRASIEEICPTL